MTQRSSARHHITTTVVRSYPVPDWLKASPNEETLADAMALAIRAQERAGVEVISDGEIGRWDLRRNAPGGMVERFVRPMRGVSTELTRAQLEAFCTRGEIAYRGAPPASSREISAPAPSTSAPATSAPRSRRWRRWTSRAKSA